MSKAAYCMAAIALLMQGCATTQPAIVSTEVREVRVPYPVPCVDPAKVPKKPSTSMDPKGDVKQRAAGAAADIAELKLYADELRVLIEPCLR